MPQNRTLTMFVLLVLFAGLATGAAAVEIRVDFGADSPAPSGNWNTVSGADVNTLNSNLIDYTTGLATAIGLSGAGWGTDDPINALWNSGLDRDWIANAAVTDDVFTGGSDASVTFVGLQPGAFYAVDVLSAYTGDGDVDIADITVNGAFASSNANGTPGQLGDDWDAEAQGFVAANYLTWSSVQADPDGEITISLVYVSGFGVDLTAARIRSLDEVPEPVPALGGVGLCALLLIVAAVAVCTLRR